MLDKIKSLLGLKKDRQLSPFLEIGFHQDKYLLEVADLCLKQSTQFIETGSNVGSTLHYVGKKYGHVRCLSCEPFDLAFDFAKKRIAPYNNIKIRNVLSPQFLYDIEKDYADLFDRPTTFWIDSHSYGYDWPLADEIRFITNKFKQAYLLIDDFKVPGKPEFGFDVYKQYECSFDYIEEFMNKDIPYTIYYPNYTEKTSPVHPLRGWVLIEFGSEPRLEIPEALSSKLLVKTYAQ